MGAARQALDVASNVTSKHARSSLFGALVSGQKYYFFIMNISSWSQNSRLHFLKRDYPLPFSATTVEKFFHSIGYLISVRRLSEMKCPMKQEISGLSKFQEKSKEAAQEFTKTTFRQFLFHLILYQRFRTFCLNGSRLSFCYS